ncbi:uncharacterized protein N7479_009441 [Penicillium vulpinum]|uniref:uncharacterized protein n=1 Tax=Penicillium vulpinum TaxID=29845 RepID=UPI002548310A|nr:uncharacterized protein N7479_009441 [Penicillium vulpinum]KAJ5951028.1 hypothetical protein N7479_009441 [Penicillium vulpinum]
MAVFQQPPSATLPPPSTTHPPPTAFCLRQPFRLYHAYWGGGAPKIASFTTIPAALWPAPSRYGYKYPFPTYSPSNTVLISTQIPLQKSPSDLPLCFLLFSSVVVPSYARRILLAIYRRTPNTGNHEITSESSYTSPIDTDNNRPFKPDSSKTDLTELERSPLAGRTIARKKLSPKTGTKSLPTVLSNIEQVKTSTKRALGLGVAEDTLREALPNNIYRFLNWCLKLEYSYTKASALEADWKYFRIYYQRVTKTEISKEIGEAVRTGIRYLVDKRGLDTQPRVNIPDPHGGPPKPIIELEPQFVKSVLGISKLNTFALPKIIYGVSLVFSPYILLFIILFYIYAFEAPHLISIEDLRRLLIEGGRQEILLPLKKEIDNYYIFLKVKVICGQPQAHSTYSLGYLVRYTASLIIFSLTNSDTEEVIYSIRVPTPLVERLLNIIVPVDEEFSKAVTRISCWIDRRRPRYLSDTDRESVEKDLELQSAIRCISGDTRGPEALSPQSTPVSRKETRRDFSRKQAVIDIERQLTSGAVSDKPAREVLRKEFEMLSEQILLEGGPLKGRRKRSAPSDNKDIVPSPPARKVKADTQLNTSWEKGYTSGGKYIPNTEQTFVYFQYPKMYSDYNGVKRYFRTLYLTDRIYNFCDLSVLHEMHLRRYTEDIYSLRI